MWKIIEHKNPRHKQEIEVKSLLNEMSIYSYASYAEQFESHFKILVKDIPTSNGFTAENQYKVTPRNHKSVEVWKLTAAGDFKTKMWTLNFVENEKS